MYIPEIISYSAVCHCVKTFKEKMNRDIKVKNLFEKIIHYSALTPEISSIFPELWLTGRKKCIIIHAWKLKKLQSAWLN